jgi:predicted DNA-binding protein (MmcQ/YjbR family)
MPLTRPEPDRFASRPAVQRLREMCLSLPETSERSSWGHPNFRAGNKTFAVAEMVKGRPTFAFRLPPADVAQLEKKDGFGVTPYGRGLWVTMWVDGKIDWKQVRRLLDRSYRTVALKRMLRILDS